MSCRCRFVGPFIPRRERQGHVNEATFTNCFVKNLPPSVDDGKLRELFEPFGELSSVKVMLDDEGASRGAIAKCQLILRVGGGGWRPGELDFDVRLGSDRFDDE